MRYIFYFLQNTMNIIFAIILWLLVNYFTGGLPFSAILCVFAGVFLVMPWLLNFDLKDFKVLWQQKKLTTINVLINVIVIPVLMVVGWFIFFPKNPEIRYSLIMLAILPGWGLLMSWIRQSDANIKYWFSLFVLNMTIFVILFFGLNYLILQNFTEQIPYNIANQTCEIEQATNWLASCSGWNAHSKPILAYIFLIILPFLFSRIIRFFPNFKEKIQKHISLISQIATFLIIWYIFSLENIHWIFWQNIIWLLKIFVTVLLGYLLVFWFSFAVFYFSKNKSDLDKSLFWNTSIRFVTLGLVFGVLYVPYLGTEYISIFASAYIVQTLISMFVLRFMKPISKI